MLFTHSAGVTFHQAAWSSLSQCQFQQWSKEDILLIWWLPKGQPFSWFVYGTITPYLKQQSREMGSSDKHNGCRLNIESDTLDRLQTKGTCWNVMLNVQKQCFCFVCVLSCIFCLHFIFCLFCVFFFCFFFVLLWFYLFNYFVLLCCGVLFFALFCMFYMVPLLFSLCNWTTFIECSNR